MTYQSVSPYDGQVLKNFEELTDNQLENAIETAATCFESWSQTSVPERAIVLARAASIMHSDIDRFAHLATLEMGKLIGDARSEVKLTADLIEYYATNLERRFALQRLEPSWGDATMEWRPYGVLFGVEARNFPYYQLSRFVVPNLVVGNVALAKHARCVPQCAIAFERLWMEAGAPTGTYTNLLISHEQVSRVIDNPRIKGVAFGGSVETGRLVAARAGKNLKKSRIEVGGSDTLIVLEDADLEMAVKWAVWGKMNNTGQSCVAAKRMIVVDEVADRFLDMFRNALDLLEPGDPMDPTTTLAPLSTEGALNKLLNQIERAVAGGATLLMGGKRVDRPGAYMQPTVLTNIMPRNPAFREEFFGPVALFFRVYNEVEAVALANDSDFGPGGSIFTKDIERGKRLARFVDTGMMYVNHPIGMTPDFPFGSVKKFGYGIYGMGNQEFVNNKLIRFASVDAPA